MLPEERRRKIIEDVAESGGSSVQELADRLDVSKATVRRDLQSLEDEGLIERSHGGAVPVESVAAEQSYRQKDVQNLDQKRAIAASAVSEIQNGQAVFFDAGTTTMQVAKTVSTGTAFIAATNSPLLAVELSDRIEGVKLTGGTLRQQTYALVGPTAESFLQRTNFDQLFLGTNAIDVDAGLTTPDEDEAQMKSLMCDNAERVVLVADRSKIGRRSFIQFGTLDDVDVFITDGPVDRVLREACDSHGVSVVDAGSE